MSRIVNGVVLSKHPVRIRHEVEDLKGETFGELTAIEFMKKDSHGRAIWKWRCSCGKVCIKPARSVKSGQIVSCGHVNREKSSERLRKLNTTHNASKEPWYSNYAAMIRRALNPNDNDKHYYNKDRINGPLIDQEWVDNPWAFYEEIGPKPDPKASIDRIDGSRGYVSGNVRWASRTLQSLNRKTDQSGRKVPYQGVICEPKGLNRRKRNRYIAVLQKRGRTQRLGSYYILNNALRRRYDEESVLGLSHTFERPSGDYEKEPDYTSGHPLINYSKERDAWRVYIDVGRGRHHNKYVGQYSTLEEAKIAQRKAYEHFSECLNEASEENNRHIYGIIAIDPKGQRYYYKSIADFHRKTNSKANIYRRLKDGKPFTGDRSTFYGWRFEYVNKDDMSNN